MMIRESRLLFWATLYMAKKYRDGLWLGSALDLEIVIFVFLLTVAQLVCRPVDWRPRKSKLAFHLDLYNSSTIFF